VNHILRCHEVVKTDLVRGRGCYLYDAQGTRYVDFEAGTWCTALGHGHWRINQVIHNQADQIIHLGTRYPHALAEEAALGILETVDIPDGKCTFLSSGSEAVEFGVQAARRITGQPLLLTLSDSYLAAYGSAGSKNPEEWYCLDWRACAACPHPDECDPRCTHLKEMPIERIGGLVFEPGSRSGLVAFPPKQLVQNLVAMVRRQQGLIMVNEVTTGLGRTGAWYGYQHYALRPDIVALGKGLGNGYPVSAVVMAQDVAGRLEDGAFRYVQSHQNDPLGCAVAREVIAVMREERLVERSKRVGTHFLNQLRLLGERHRAVIEVRGRGLMIAIELEEDCGGISAESAYRQLLQRGFLVGYSAEGNLLRLYPPLTIGEEDVAQLVESLDQILEASS
jgi:acetylornithine/N-succinyldiaminopimelate aminotransferase